MEEVEEAANDEEKNSPFFQKKLRKLFKTFTLQGCAKTSTATSTPTPASRSPPASS